MQLGDGICGWRRPVPKDCAEQEEEEKFLIKRSMERLNPNLKRIKDIARSENIPQRSKSKCNIIKSANVFLTKEGVAKLGDMNVSKLAKNGMLFTQTGTPYYASPEVWKDKPYDSKSDIWSFGCVIYEMTTLEPPFKADDMEGLF